MGYFTAYWPELVPPQPPPLTRVGPSGSPATCCEGRLGHGSDDHYRGAGSERGGHGPSQAAQPARCRAGVPEACAGLQRGSVLSLVRERRHTGPSLCPGAERGGCRMNSVVFFFGA